MSVLHFIPPMPELGPARTMPHPTISSEPMVNVAGVVRVARECATPKSLRFYRAFCAAWDRVKDGPQPDGTKQKIAMQEALAEVGHRIDFLDMDTVANRPPSRKD